MNTRTRQRILSSVYIKRHSPSTRDNTAMRRVASRRCLTYISLAFSHVTFDYRRVNAFNQQRAISTTPQGSSSFFLSRDYSFPMQSHVRFVNSFPRLGKTRLFFHRLYSQLLIFFLYQARRYTPETVVCVCVCVRFFLRKMRKPKRLQNNSVFQCASWPLNPAGKKSFVTYIRVRYTPEIYRIPLCEVHA